MKEPEIFVSPTHGPMPFDAMVVQIVDFITAAPPADYRVIVGTDSQEREQTVFVTAIVIHRIGKGARYYYAKQAVDTPMSLQQRIFHEASRSLQVAGRLVEQLAQRLHLEPEVEIHLDVGTGGATKALIREIVGMVTGSGFDAKIKPEAYAASSVADKHTK